MSSQFEQAVSCIYAESLGSKLVCECLGVRNFSLKKPSPRATRQFL